MVSVAQLVLAHYNWTASRQISQLACGTGVQKQVKVNKAKSKKCHNGVEHLHLLWLWRDLSLEEIRNE